MLNLEETTLTNAGTAVETDNSGSGWHSQLHQRLAAGQFAVTVEVPSPRDVNLDRFRRSARAVRDWIDAANVTDGLGATVHLPSWVTSLVLMEEGIEPVMQLQCRDRNRIALQADLLGAAAVGIPNVLLLTGDPPQAGDHPDAKAVFDLDSLRLIETARTMRDHRRLLSGRKLSAAPRWFIGAAEDPFGAVQQGGAERLRKKVAAGAQFIQTQFVFDVPAFARWMEQVRDLGLHHQCFILAGIGPIRSLRALEFLSHELPGIHIPEEVVRRLRGVPDHLVAAEGVAICVETILQLRGIPGVAGIHLMAGRPEDYVPEVLTRAGLGQRSPAAAGEASR